MTLSKMFTSSAILALSLVSGHAQSGETVHIHVPFSFMAAGRELPAGDYIFEQSGQGGSWLIHGQASSVGLLTSFGGPNASDSAAAEFSVSDGHKYLDEIRLPDGTVRHVLYRATK